MKTFRKLLSLMIIPILILNASPVSAIQPEEDTIIVTYDAIPDGVIETTTINEAGTITTIYRKVYSSGTIDVIIDQELIASLDCANYQAFLNLVGTTQTFPLYSNAIAPAYESYGCGQEYMIHKYVNTESYSFYKGDISTATKIAKVLAAAFGLPIAAGLLTVGTAIFNAFKYGNNLPQRIDVTLRNYMLYDVDTDAFVMNCHHYLISKYDQDENGNFVFRESEMKYGVS